MNDNKFGTGEAHQLRLAFEKVSGKDLNVFFNQWYFSSGHPKLEIKYTYSEAANLVTVQINQTQENMFEFPFAIDVYEGAKPKRYNVWVDEKEKSFTFKYTKKPKLVNAGANRTLLAEITDNKTIENYIHLYTYGGQYEDRREAIEVLSENQSDDSAYKVLVKAMTDKYYGLRILAIDKVDISKANSSEAINIIEKLAVNDEKTLVQAKAISKLEMLENSKYIALYNGALKSKSSSVKGSALKALYKVDKEAALTFANGIESDTERESLKDALIPVYILDKTEAQMPFVADNLIAGMFFTEDNSTRNIYKEGFQWVASSSNEEATQNLVDSFVQMGNQYKQYGADKMAIQVLQQVLAAKNELSTTNKEVLVKMIQDGLVKLQ